jgi:hypothetical protein
MIQIREAPVRAGDAGTEAETSLLGGVDGSEIAQKSVAAQAENAFPGGLAAVADLKRAFATEALRVVAVKARHAADDIGLGDDAAAERSIRIAIAHLREGAAAFREMQCALQTGADRIIAEAVR